MSYIKTVLPHTYENQAVLREYGEKISKGVAHSQPTPSLSIWSRIASYFPSLQFFGYTAGSHLALTYGAQWSNSAIDCVVRQFFKNESTPSSFWIWDSVKDFFSGATQSTVAETLKLTLTPKIVPYITILTGTTGAVALPVVVSLVSLVYQKVMDDPRKLQQLSKLKVEEFFTIDEKTGRLRDAFGRLMSKEDMQDILTAAAKYDLICKLIDLCHRIDLIEGGDDTLQKELQNELDSLINTYLIKRQDGKFMFPDGNLCTSEEKKVIKEGATILSRINPLHKTKKIHALIKTVAKHSLAPLEVLSSADKSRTTGSIGVPKRMPSALSKKSVVWEEGVIRSRDGKYVMVREVGGKKRGDILSNVEIQTLFDTVITSV